MGVATIQAATTVVAAQDPIKPAAVVWKVSESFKKIAEGDLSKQARTNLSGAACASKVPPFVSCLIVNDEKKYAQFFSIDGTILVPGAVIRLLPGDTKGDPDAEGAAYDNGFFYATGSHGRSRHHPEKNSDPSYVVFRFPVDKTTGKPTFQVSDDEPIGVESTVRLREAIKNGTTIASFYDKPLGENGVNVEGIAVKDGRMYLGLRGPSVDNQAFIVSVDAAAVFTKDGNLKVSVKPLKLGATTGIRDLASVDGGLLVLSGPVNDQKEVVPAVFFWDPMTENLKKLGELAIPKPAAGEMKAEILLVLRDVPGEPWRVLVMFDGQENGAPTEYLIPR